MFSLQSIGIKILGVLLLSGLLSYGCYYEYNKAYQSGFQAEKLIRDNTDLLNNQKAQAALLKQTQTNDQLQLSLNDQVSAIQSQLIAEKASHEKTKQDLINSINATNSGVRVNSALTSAIKVVNSFTSSNTTNSSGTATASTSNDMSKFTETIVSAADSDRELLQHYQALAALYNDARNTCNKE
jgi:hypothetical protein